jgi:hypothetical protein
MIDYLACQLL